MNAKLAIMSGFAALQGTAESGKRAPADLRLDTCQRNLGAKAAMNADVKIS